MAEVEAGRCVLELELDERHYQPNGVVQGGIISAVADAAMGMAIMTVQELGKVNTTIELKINFIRPAVKGRVRAVGSVVKQGRSVIFAEAEVYNAAGKLLAKATSSCLEIEAAPRA